MTALRDTPVPVPRTFAYCADPSVIGTPFFVMDCVEGRIFLGPGDIQQRLPIFLEEVYNRRPLHSALRYMPPDEFEQQHALRQVNP